MNTKILVILIILIGLGVGGVFVYRSIFQAKSEKEEAIPGIEGKGSVKEEIYKGVWMATLSLTPLRDWYKPTLMDLDRAAEDGVDTLSFSPNFLANKEGKVWLIPGTKNFLISFIDEARARGFKIWLTPGIVYVEKDINFSEEIKTPSPIPTEILENTDLLQNFDLAVVEWAKIAEEHKVEVFSPVNEPHVIFGTKIKKEWLAEIKPKIEAVYKGKLCLKGEWEWDMPGLLLYSCFAPTIEIPRNKEQGTELINTIGRWSEETKERNIELILGEIWQGGNWIGTAEDAKRGFAKVFEAGEGKVSGFFVIDLPHFPPPFDRTLTPVHIEDFEDVLKEFYTSELK